MRRGILRFSRQAGDVSDDTQLCICVARSIGLDGSYNHQRFLNELGRWSYSRIGAGRACASSAIAARRHRKVSNRSEGNGVAIRVAPIAIATAQRSDKELVAIVAKNGRETHGGDAAIEAAVFVALLLKRALKSEPSTHGKRSELRELLLECSASSGFEVCLPSDEVLDSEPSFAALIHQVGTSGHVHQSVHSAALVLLRHTIDYQAAMQTVFRAGGDTDSIGAMVGAVIGAQIGASRIPAEWGDGIQHQDYLCYLADRLSNPMVAEPRTGTVVRVVGDVAQRRVDVVVNAWNRNVIPPWLLVPQGVSKAIRRAGGRELLRIMGRQAPLPLGAAVETAAPEMQCQWVIHVAGINLLWRASETSVRASTRNALLLASWLGARSVALPVIGAGSGGLSSRAAEAVIANELEAHRSHFDLVEIVVLDAPCDS